MLGGIANIDGGLVIIALVATLVIVDDKTSFSIAHRLATIRDSDDIMVLNSGEIVEYAPHDELMDAKGFYYGLYMSQFKGEAPGGVEAADIDFVST